MTQTTELPPCHCGKTHSTLEHRECMCIYTGCCEPQNSLLHCGRTSYGCWLKDFTAEELAEMETLAKATIQGDGDFSWWLIEGHGKSPGGIWRDQCGNEPIAYDAYDVDVIDLGKESLPEEPPFPRNWLEMSEVEKKDYCAKIEVVEQAYCKTHPDITFMGHMHPGRVLRLIQMARRSMQSTVPKADVIHEEDCVGLPGCSCRRAKK